MSWNAIISTIYFQLFLKIVWLLQVVLVVYGAKALCPKSSVIFSHNDGCGLSHFYVGKSWQL